MMRQRMTGLCLIPLLAVATTLTYADRNVNPRVAPINSTPSGMTYGEWSGAWWQWAFGIPAAENPILDGTGEFGDIDQQGSVWFLAGTFGDTVERDLSVPPGKKLFFPVINSVWWAPDDVEFAAFVVDEFLGLDPADFTDEELIALTAVFQVTFESLEMTCMVDGVEIADVENYFAVSPGFPITDTDLLDDLEAPISQPNMAVSAGYWLMLNPLSRGEHTVRFTADGQGNPLFGDFALDVTYNIAVE